MFVSVFFGVFWVLFVVKEFFFIYNINSGEILKILILEYEVVDCFEIGLFMDYFVVFFDGCIFYVNCIDLFVLEQGWNIGEFGELFVVDLVSGVIFWCVVFDGMLYYMLVLKDGCYVFVLYYDIWWFVVVDMESCSVVQKIFFGYGLYGIKFLFDGCWFYVGLMMNDMISIVDIESFDVVDCILFDDGVCFFVLMKDEEMFYVQFLCYYSFEIVDVVVCWVIGCVEMLVLLVGIEMLFFYLYNVNYGIVFMFDELKLFVNGLIVDYVVVYLYFELELIKMILMGDDFNLIVFDLQGCFVYVLN